MKFSCEKCGKTFHRKYYYKRHLKTHEIDRKRKFKCVLCDVSYFHKKNLTFHLKAVHKIENGNKNLQTYDCTFCKKEFQGMYELEIHLRSHSLERPFLCNACPAEFISQDALTKHFKLHHEAKPSRYFFCDFCTKSFIIFNELTKHLRVHLGEKPFKCNICDKNFTRKGDLPKHLRIHTGEKPFACKVCDKAFNQTSSLNGHMQVHSKGKSFNCQGCEKTFQYRRSLKRHEKTAHV